MGRGTADIPLLLEEVVDREVVVMSEQIRVLVLADSRAFHTARYVAELRRQGCQVLLASLEEGSTLHYQLKNRGPIQQLWYSLAATEIRALVRRFNPDIINPHFASGYGFSSALAQLHRFAPVLLHLWGSDILIVPQKSVFHRRKTAYALRQADFVLGDSDYLVKTARQLTEIRDSKVIYWGIERQFLGLHRSNYSLGAPLRIIVPRQHEKVYNNEFLVQSLAPLINGGKVELTFPSFGSLSGHFRLTCKSIVGDRLHFYEKLPRAEFLRFMAMHDIYLSGAISDSSPASLIEAMALGLIPVTADIAGVREWLSPDSGFVFQQYNRQALHDTIGNIMESNDPLIRMRIQNLERVKREAVFENNIGDTIAVMRALIARRRF
jgi:glycosyltransferase involved in cell wall biosynthesis